jgi:hypothetical protein
MRLRLHAGITASVMASAAILGCAHVGGVSKKSKPEITEQARLEAIRRAQVWKPTDVPSMDMIAGPQGSGAFPPDATVTCNYLDKRLGGNTPKFACLIPPDDELKVKYGRDNGEVYAEVAAARLFWALGFYAERMYPVRVVCNGCPPKITGTEMASIERKVPGKDIETKRHVGWAWPEIDLVSPAAGGAPIAQRDALKLLAVFIQHSDSKPEQQRLVCAGKGKKDAADPSSCEETVMMVHDLGLTFGHANYLNRASVGGVQLEQWAHAHVWKDAKRCIGNLPESATGTLDNPLITEEGRAFLAKLLTQLTDAQLHDLFSVARFNRRSTTSDAAPDTSAINQWVAAFKEKRDEVVNRSCPG